VKLSCLELHKARSVGQRRNKENRSVDRTDGKVLEDSLEIDVLGAEAELAVSRFLNIPWDGRFFRDAQWLKWRKGGHDVGPIEVRATLHKTGRLIVHPKDDDDAPFILVRASRRPIFDIVGWQWGGECKKEEYWQDVGYGRPCFYLPNNKLRPVKELYA
jgi:hypothetical protein